MSSADPYINKTSVTGVLIGYVYKDSPAWAPHRLCTNAQAVDAVLRHMKRDSLQPELMGSRGPVWDDSANGNFFMASAGFHIVDLNKTLRARLLDAWYEHVKSRQYNIVVEILEIDKKARAEADELQKPKHGYDDRRERAMNPYRDHVKTLEAELESIYRSNL